MAVKSNPRTRSQAATNRKSPVRIPDIGLKRQKGTITKGATNNPPKLTSARRIVERNDGVSSNRGKQPAGEFTDENAPHENQNIVPSTFAKKKNEAIEAHSFRLTEIVAMMDHGSSRVPQNHVPYLQMICSVCQLLENTSLKDVMDTELKAMCMIVEGIRYMGFDVKWLLERLEDIIKEKRLVKDYLDVNKEESKLDMELKEIAMLEQQLSAAKANFTAKKMEVDKVKHDINQEIADLRAKGLAVLDKSLLYGLNIST